VDRAGDWKQFALLLLALAGIFWFAFRVIAPPAHPSHHSINVDAAHGQLATRFVQALLVRGDCAAAAPLASAQLGVPQTKGCWAFVDRQLGGDYYQWRLVRDSGAIVSGCVFGPRLADRYGIDRVGAYTAEGPVAVGNGDDCVAYRLVTPLDGAYQGGYLIVWPGPRHEIWKIRGLVMQASQGGRTCLHGCRGLWARRVPRVST
jgi:hypothetical protein